MYENYESNSEPLTWVDYIKIGVGIVLGFAGLYMLLFYAVFAQELMTK